LQSQSKRFLQIIDEALLDEEKRHTPVQEVSFQECGEPLPLIARLRIVPRQYLRKHEEMLVCEEFAKRTGRNPLRYDPGSKESMKKISKWFTKFSQGDNKEGERLYIDCPGACSPQYYLTLFREQGSYRILADVICGKPRDQYDNYYLLSGDLSRCCPK
jgi:hypothetical protein